MTKELFFDTDCLSSFLWIGDTSIIEALYGGRIVLPEPVYKEIDNPSVPHLKEKADKLISSNKASVQNIEMGTKEYELYKELSEYQPGKKTSSNPNLLRI